MIYIATGLAFGLAWAAIQFLRGDVADPSAAVVAVLACAGFGALLWGLRTLVLRLVGRLRASR